MPTSSWSISDQGSAAPARYLANRFGCKVHGIDLTPSFVEAAKFLTDLCGLQQRVSFSCANALDLPFTDHSVDLVWTQHVAMNISDREGLYREVFRVLKPGGNARDLRRRRRAKRSGALPCPLGMRACSQLPPVPRGDVKGRC